MGKTRELFKDHQIDINNKQSTYSLFKMLL